MFFSCSFVIEIFAGDFINFVVCWFDYKIIRGISKEYKTNTINKYNNNGTDLSNPADVTEAEEYDGTASAVVWVEPDAEPVTAN